MLLQTARRTAEALLTDRGTAAGWLRQSSDAALVDDARRLWLSAFPPEAEESA